MEVEKERGDAAPPRRRCNKGLDGDASKAPTRELIALWTTERERLGLGPEASFGRHGRAFADLFSRAHQDADLCRQVITLYFREPPELAQKNGKSISTFQAVMDRCLQTAIDRRPQTLAEAVEPPSLQDVARADAESMQRIRAEREKSIRNRREGINSGTSDLA